VILAVMYRRREGLLGRLEVDEMLVRWWRGRRATAMPDRTEKPADGTRGG